MALLQSASYIIIVVCIGMLMLNKGKLFKEPMGTSEFDFSFAYLNNTDTNHTNIYSKRTR